MKFARLVVAAAALLASVAAWSQVVYTVTVPGDALDGLGEPVPGTLRYAIKAANLNCNTTSTAFAPTIKFDIQSATFGTGPYVVQPPAGLPLPPLSCMSTTLDATTQPGWSANGPTFGGTNNANLRIVLDGSLCGAACNGIEVRAIDTRIRGLSIRSFGGAGIYAAPGAYAGIEGNFIGISGKGNGKGVVIDGADGYIGGGSGFPERANSISGNTVAGIYMNTGSSFQISGNQIDGNGIGIDFVNASGNQQVTSNFIRFNSGPGILAETGLLYIASNSIHDNTDEGIALGGPNPPPVPVITALTNDGTNTTVTGFVDARTISTVNAYPVGIEIFSNARAFPEGDKLEAVVNTSIDTSVSPGSVNFTATLAGLPTNVTATATFDTCFEGCFRTSEFSAPAQAPTVVGIFNPALIAPGGSTEFMLVVGNPNSTTMSGVQYAITLPSSLKMSAAPTWDADCGTDFGRGSDTTAGTFNVFSLNLASGQSCTVHVPLVTPAGGTYTIAPGAMSVNSSFGTGRPSSSATLLVTQPGITSDFATLAFGNVAVGTTGTLVVTILSNGTAPMTTSGVSAVTSTPSTANAFGIQSQNCTTAGALGPGATCTVTVKFTPPAPGSYTGQLSITSDAATSPYNVSLVGTGTAPSQQLSTTSLVFGNQMLGTTSAAQSVGIDNTGTADLTIQGVVSSAPSEFSVSGCTSGTVAPGGATCVVQVKFTPAAGGARTGTVTITSNDASSPRTVNVSGTGIVPAPTVSPASFDFGTVPLGGSASTTFTVTNGTSVAIPLSTGLAATGFSSASTCPSTLNAGASCTVTVAFTPKSVSAFSGTLQVISTSTTPNIVNVPVSGTGSSAPPGPAVQLSPTSVTFARQAVGTTSSPQNVVLTNTGVDPLHITSIASSGDFGYSGCGFPLTLAPDASCTFAITFSPSANGPLTGDITITSDAPGSPHAIALTGTGANGPQPGISLSSTPLLFGNVRVGSQATRVTTISSNGSAPLAIASISTSGGAFSQGNSCPASLPVGGACDITVTFHPTAEGLRTGELVIASNGDPASLAVPLSGNGVPIPPAVLTVDRLLDFGQRIVGTTTRLPLVLHNTGEQTLNINGLQIHGGAFALEGACSSIVPGGTCTLTLVFSPAAVDTLTGRLDIASNDARGTIGVDLLGQGLAVPQPEIELSVDGIGFANQLMTTRSTAQAIDVRSVGTAPLHIRGVSVTGPFVLSGGCPDTLPAGASCTVAVTFLPLAPGPAEGRLTVDSDAEAGRGFASLTGSGCRFFSVAANRILARPCGP